MVEIQFNTPYKSTPMFRRLIMTLLNDIVNHGHTPGSFLCQQWFILLKIHKLNILITALLLWATYWEIIENLWDHASFKYKFKASLVMELTLKSTRYPPLLFHLLTPEDVDLLQHLFETSESLPNQVDVQDYWHPEPDHVDILSPLMYQIHSEKNISKTYN